MTSEGCYTGLVELDLEAKLFALQALDTGRSLQQHSAVALDKVLITVPQVDYAT